MSQNTNSSSPQRRFRIQAKAFFLTYAQAESLWQEDIVEVLKLVPEVNKILVAKELHQDEGIHYHCYLGLKERLLITEPAYFDIRGYHPNIQAIRSPKAVIEYCKKDGNYIAIKQEGGCSDWEMWDLVIKYTYRDCLEETTMEGFIKTCCKTSARDFIIMNDKIISFAKAKYRAVDDEYKPKHLAFQPTEEMAMWRWLNLTFPDNNEDFRPKSLILVSPTRYGKTEWARSLGNHWYCGGLFNLENLKEDATYGVLDDIPVELFKYQYKQFIGCQKNFTVSDKYKRKQNFKWGKPVIYLCNNKEYEKMETEWDMEWIRGNSEIVILERQLY